MQVRLSHRFPRLLLTAALLLSFLLAPAAARAQGPAPDDQQGGGFENLAPGGRVNLQERVPVNYVFVGYEPGDVRASGFLARLPKRYRPISRVPSVYARKPIYLGLNYTYDHNVVYADAEYERRFFRFLSNSARPAPLTVFMNGTAEDGVIGYNNQQNNARVIRSNNYISAPAVERYLAKNPPRMGLGTQQQAARLVDTTRNTVYFINWWGNKATPRPGFKHHVYVKTNEPDPDTRYNFGVERDSRKIIAWGGTTANDEESGLGKTHRVWFYDLSAGPDAFTSNYNVDDADVDGDRVADYRIPPVWEYFIRGGYRQRSALTADLARVARYVAINLLFTSSPLYPPEFTPQLLPKAINLDLNTYEGIPGVNASRRFQKPAFVRSEVSEVHRLPYSVDANDLPFDRQARRCYELLVRPFNTGQEPQRCYPERTNYPAFANLFLNNALKIGTIRDDERANRLYEAPLINYAVEDGPNGETSPPFLGFADDNYRDGTQSFIFSFVSPGIAEAGYGLSTTEVHEYGHHLNLSHPHDGYDFERNLDYGPSGPFTYAFVGTESNTIMSYIDLNWDFSQFDRDNTNRFQASSYVKYANRIAGRILRDPDAGRAEADLREADRRIGAAKAALRRHNYNRTFDEARSAYEAVLRGARKAGVRVTESQEGVKVTPTGRTATSLVPGSYVDKPEHAHAPSALGREDGTQGATTWVTPLDKRNAP